MNNFSGEYLYNNCKHTGRLFLSEADQVMYMDWSGAGITFRTKASRLEANFKALWAPEYEGIPGDFSAPFHKNWPWIAVFMDGEEILKKELDSEAMTIVLWEGDACEHEFSIIKLTENYKTQLGIASLSVEGELLETQPGCKDRIEFVGDSITCGFGNMTLERDRFFYTMDENALFAHGPLAAKMLDMDYSLVSVSGICATTNTGLPMEYAMDQLYEYTDRVIEDKLSAVNTGKKIDGGAAGELAADNGCYQKYDFAAHPNKVVVINLGTNDGTGMFMSADEKTELKNFEKGYSELISTVRRCNGPSTHIICALGTMNYYLLLEIMRCVENYKTRTGDEKVSFFRYTGLHPMDGLGACAHPSQASQAKMAAEIAEEVRRILK